MSRFIAVHIPECIIAFSKKALVQKFFCLGREGERNVYRLLRSEIGHSFGTLFNKIAKTDFSKRKSFFNVFKFSDVTDGFNNNLMGADGNFFT